MRPPVRLLLALSAAGLLLGAPADVWAEDSVAVIGNYWKERSTRVISPAIKVKKSLPEGFEVEAGYLVDQITSASGAFTLQDELFTDYRQEGRFSVRNKLFGLLTPGLSFRFSVEADYSSFGYGADLAVELFDARTTLRTYLERVHDTIGFREVPTFAEDLETTLLGISAVQIVDKNLLLTLTLETQIQRGFQQSAYRMETHPKERDRFTGALSAAYRFTDIGTTIKGGYRFYADDWSLVANSFEVEVWQELLPYLEIAPRFRFHSQTGVSFAGPPQPNATFFTADPKLQEFPARFYAVRLRWTQSWTAGTFLELFSRSVIEPLYAYLDQDNFYGPAHIAQLGWYWPF